MATATDIRVIDSPRERLNSMARDAVLARTWGSDLPTQAWNAAAGDFIDWSPLANKQATKELGTLPGLVAGCMSICGYSQADIGRLSAADMARIVLGKDPSEFGLSAYSDGPARNLSGMFTSILFDANNVLLRRSYKEAKTTFGLWMKRAPDVTDFRQVNRVIAGEIGDPKPVHEDGEFAETGTLSDGRVSYRMTIWGEAFSITWQAVANDQLKAFTAIPIKQGAAMRRKQNRLAYGVLKDNFATPDGGLLFNASALSTVGGHNNLTTGAAVPSMSTLNTMAAKLAEQYGLNSGARTALNLQPKYILAGPALRGSILELIGSESYAQANGNAGVRNVWKDALTPIIDPELSAAAGGSDTAWYLVADSNDIDTIEYAYLQGMESPAMDKVEAFDRLAVRFRIYQPFAVKAIDFRGLQKHNGQ